MAGVDGHIFRAVAFGWLFNEGSYPKLAQLWESVINSDEAAVRQQLNASNASAGSPADQPATGAELSPADNSLSVFLAVTCNDVDWSANVKDYQDAVAEDRVTYPLYGPAAANITPCAFWPYEPAEPPAAAGTARTSLAAILRPGDHYDLSCRRQTAQARQVLPGVVMATGHQTLDRGRSPRVAAGDLDRRRIDGRVS